MQLAKIRAYIVNEQLKYNLEGYFSINTRKFNHFNMSMWAEKF